MTPGKKIWIVRHGRRIPAVVSFFGGGAWYVMIPSGWKGRDAGSFYPVKDIEHCKGRRKVFRWAR
ncbi:MAG: hypothetical protein IIA59_00480 [Candidatus Marinimicrobia bacterium]|nr:hypothetical protein [Candidatus Neomarinimicrobiota bacterium]